MTLSAIRPLLSLISNEAQLLRGVSGDVQFIKDEMESIKGFLLNLERTRAGAGNDYQLRAWMAQVVDLAYDSGICIEDYVQSGCPPGRNPKGLADRLLHTASLPKRLLLRRSVAKRIRKLKIRAWEIGKRQQRYAVHVPPSWTDPAPARVQEQTPLTHPVGDSPQRSRLGGPDMMDAAPAMVQERPPPTHPLAGGSPGWAILGEPNRMDAAPAAAGEEQFLSTHPAGGSLGWTILGGPDKMDAALAARVQERPPSTQLARDSPQWAILSGPDILTQAKVEMLQWLVARSEQRHTRTEQDDERSSWLETNILGVVTLDGVDGASLADQVYQQCRGSSATEPLNFDCVVHITVQRPPLLVVMLLDMLRQLFSEEYFRSLETNTMEAWDVDRITSEIRECLRGKRLLLLLSNMDYPLIWCLINNQLQTFPCSDRSVVVFFTSDPEVATKCDSSETKVYSLVDFFSSKAVALVPTKFDLDEDRHFHLLIKQILGKCTPDVYCMSLFLHALLSNPNRTEQELESLHRSLDPGRSVTAIERQNLMLTFCYHGLHKDYQHCLWYSTAFTRGTFMVRRASLLRRWVAEGLIQRAGLLSAMAEAERCFDTLLTQKLLLPREVSGTGNIKSCGLNALFNPIMDATTDAIFLDTNNLPDDLELHFSIRNQIQLRRMTESAGVVVDSVMSAQRNTRTEQKNEITMAFLKRLPTSSSFRLLRVLELEGYKGFKKGHLKNICKIHQLRYLNLRNTDIKQFPKEINQLLLLETLDIRGTRVKELNAVLPLLKHLLAGRISLAGQEDTVKSKETFSTVRLPHGATRMTNLEVLSHVKVSNNAKELREAARKLPLLRKLGVVLCGKRHNNLENIFNEIKQQFNGCFASLSMRVEPRGNWGMNSAAPLPLPSCLKSLRICGITGWLPSSIGELRQLTKITLRETSLSKDVLPILGALEGLVCLRLLYHSLQEVAAVFNAGQFRSLKDLVVEDDMIQSISFDTGTSPMLGKMVWSFHHMNSLKGVQNLPSLRYLELNRGTYEPDGLRNLQQDIIPNRVHLSLNPPEEGQGQESLPPVDADATS
ncbi:unnamed protein product [Urochloa decumbens]|uniref:Rx N-terminal domain-containing protein n=1 Tax=Urochloa decumbens TaxID=240449 RepID=A0ABC9AGD4_9POAL